MSNNTLNVQQFYISISNYKRIIRKFDSNQFKDIVGELYKKPVECFSKKEVTELLALQKLMQDPDGFISVYRRLNIEPDTHTYIYESTKPKYHENEKCDLLNSNFRNFEIPVEIRIEDTNNTDMARQINSDSVNEFRKWFKINRILFDTNLPKFTQLFQIKYKDIPVNFKSIEINNSGIISQDNFSLEELEYKIDELLLGSINFTKTYKEDRILYSFSPKCTYKGYNEEALRNNTTGFSDEEVKEVLRNYAKKVKKPLKRFLLTYYMIKFNPDLGFSGYFLESLNFKTCEKCTKITEHSYSTTLLNE